MDGQPVGQITGNEPNATMASPANLGTPQPQMGNPGQSQMGLNAGGTGNLMLGSVGLSQQQQPQLLGGMPGMMQPALQALPQDNLLLMLQQQQQQQQQQQLQLQQLQNLNATKQQMALLSGSPNQTNQQNQLDSLMLSKMMMQEQQAQQMQMQQHQLQQQQLHLLQQQRLQMQMPGLMPGVNLLANSNLDLSSGGSRKGRTGTFPKKLHQMLTDLEAQDGGSEIASFDPYGRTFSIKQPREFTENVMPNYFRMSRFSSFQRQLNLYDFQRVTDGPEKGSYYHELFVKDKPALCTMMKRIKIKGTKVRGTNSHKEPATDGNGVGGISATHIGVTGAQADI